MIHKWLHAAELGAVLFIVIAVGSILLALAWAGLQWIGQWATWGIAW